MFNVFFRHCLANGTAPLATERQVEAWILIYLIYFVICLVYSRCFALTGGSLTKLAYYSTVQHKVAKVRSFDKATKVNIAV